jgi:signal transduction histidine kinase
VSDTGIGIAAKNLPYVFDRFWQADGSSKRKYQGVGIGLSLVKELTELHGGKVSVESQEGKGTTFIVRIPYIPSEAGTTPRAIEGAVNFSSTPTATAPQDKQSEEWLANLYRRAELFPTPNAQEKIEPEKSTASGPLPKILVADDELDMLRFLNSQLRNQFEVNEASDGKQAVEKALAMVPDMILVDMNMPEKDGLQVCRELREHTSTRNIPVIMLTARADEQTKLAALSAGANDFLAKPFSTTELNVRIRNLLERHVYEEKLAEKNQALEQTIEQLKQTELQLVQTEKMVSMGRMSAGIIHEINNPLNYAATGLYTLRKQGAKLPAEQQAQFAEVLTDVEDGINRVKNIVLDLRKFSRAEDELPGTVEAFPVIQSALRFLSNEWKENVQIEVAVPENLTVVCSQSRLLQVFVNLLQNAIDSVVAKKFPDGEKPVISISGSMENGKSTLKIRDNGGGISEGDLRKIFDPFFTTKEIGEGMGLGLSICFQIVQECGGQIRASSEIGKFAEFTLEFPTAR